MTRFGEMASGVLVLGLIAAAHLATSQADSQVDPSSTGFQTFLAALCLGGWGWGVGNVIALFGHVSYI